MHVLPLPGRDVPRREIWDRFARLVGADPDSVDLSQSFPNTSMGVVEAETLRRVNHHLDGFSSAIDRGTYIRSPSLPTSGSCRAAATGSGRRRSGSTRSGRRGRDAVDFIGAAGFDVVGDPSSLLVPEELPERRTPDSVTEAEVAQVAVELVATMLGDVRDLRHERRELRAEVDDLVEMTVRPSLRLALASRFPRLQRFIRLPESPGST